MPKEILFTDNLTVELKIKNQFTPMLNNISLCLKEGEIFALTGNSGAGKSLLCHTILGLKHFCNTDFRQRGKIIFRGKNLLEASNREMQDLYRRQFFVLFQNPSAIFDPMLTVGRHMTEVLTICLELDQKTALLRLESALEKAGLPSDPRILSSPPSNLSRGTLQKLALALCLAKKPQFVIADEAVSALDCISQIQVLSSLIEICKENNSSCLFVTHHIGLASRFADRIAVIDKGTICEINSISEFLKNPQHPESQKLLKETRQLYNNREQD